MAHTIKFTDPEEFMDELEREKDVGRLDSSVVRLTQLLLPTNAAKITNVAAVATAQVGNDIFRMEYSCGARWEIFDTLNTGNRFDDVRAEIGDRCQKLGLKLYEGMFEET